MDLIERSVAKARAHGQHELFYRKAASDSLSGPVDRWRFVDGVADFLTLNPHNLEANRIVSWNKRDDRTPAYDMLRTKILMTMKSNGWRTLAITAPTEGCGKTVVAINLAFSMAHQMSAEVLLVDLDLRRPRVASYLDIQPSAGVTAFLEGRGPLTTYPVTAGGARLRVAPNVETRSNATELLSHEKCDELFNQVKTDGDSGVRIFDLPPLLPRDDAVAVIPRIDCILLVVAESVTKKADVSESLNLIDEANMLGVVYNMSRSSFITY